jgi:hypothetical protein
MLLGLKRRCCKRKVNVDYNLKYKATYTARRFGPEQDPGDINHGNIGLDTTFESLGPEVDVNNDDQGNESTDLSQEIKDMVMDDFKNNPDQWTEDETYDDSNIGPEQEIKDFAENNWDMLTETSNGGWAGGKWLYGQDNPYPHEFKQPVRRKSREAIFCRGKFERWVEPNRIPL